MRIFKEDNHYCRKCGVRTDSCCEREYKDGTFECGDHPNLILLFLVTVFSLIAFFVFLILWSTTGVCW